MKNIIGILLTFVILCFTRSCSQTPTQTTEERIPPRALTTAESKIVDSDNCFGIKLFKEINKGETTKSVFISPLSISMALGMTLNGASDATYDSMRNTLELAGLTEQEINESYKSLIELLTGIDPKVKFDIANSIWYRQGLPVEQNFVKVNKDYFNAEVKSLNFSDPSSGGVINRWVDEKTNGKIKEIVPVPIPGDVVMYLINAIYFKGLWSNQFKKENTKDDFFNLINGTRKPCKMMYNKGDFKYFENEQLQAVDLLYGDSLFSMTILLPKRNVSIDALIGQLSKENWDSWIRNLRVQEGEIYLPKFKLAYEKSLNDVLKTLGMGIAFTPYIADFSRIAKPENLGGESLYITNVRHKSFVEVDEEGTVAAAVTSVEIGITSVPQLFEMRVDRPFIFTIREKSSGTILFTGKILDISS